MSLNTAEILPSTPPDLARNSNLNLLVVEDSEDDFDLMVRLLHKADLRPQALRVQTETEMRHALETGDWHLVISDDRLPGFSSAAALALLHEQERDLPFIIVSGVMDEDAAVAALHQGADYVISKSRLSRLVPAIERSLRSAESRRLRLEAERSLRENASRLRALAANAPGMLVEFHFHDGQISFTHVSAGSQLLLGIDPEQLIASPEMLLDGIDADDRDVLFSRLSGSNEHSGIVAWEGRARPGGAKAKLHWIQLGASGRRDENGQLVWAGIVTDITALKRSEAELETSHKELREVSAHMQLAREFERARIAREIHDDIGGTITALRADVAWLKHRLNHDLTMMEKLRYMDELIESAAGASMRIVRDLRPAVLDFGIVSALEWLSKDIQKHAAIACHFSSNVEDVEIEPERATAVFRVFQELLTNITKHARASNVHAHLLVSEHSLTLEVRDDGVGIVHPNRRRSGSFGIRGMQERARELGGVFELQPGQTGGTLAVLRVPLHSLSALKQP